MPRYDYKCPECKKIEEEVHGMQEKPKIICEECKVEKLKLIGGKGVRFFFSGIVARWMENNYEKYRGNTLTTEDEDKVVDPDFSSGKGFHTR